VRTDHNVHLAAFELLDRLFLLARCAKTRHHFHIDRIITETLPDRIVVLLCQDRGRHQEGYLLVVVDCFEGSTDRNLRLTVTDIATDQAIHNLATLHIALGGSDRIELIRRLLIRKHLLELSLPDSVRAEPVTGLLLPLRIKLDEFSGDLLYGSADSRLCLFPFDGI